MRLAHAPERLKVVLYAAAAGIILYLSLAPTDAVPAFSLWDKAQHALAWAGLTGLGLLFWPGRWRVVAAFALLLGLGVELLQATLGFGRYGDWRDLVADAVGVLAALRLAQAWRWARRRA